MQVHEWFGGSILLTATTTPVLHYGLTIEYGVSETEQPM